MICNFKTCPYSKIGQLPAEKRRRGNQGTKERRTYVNALCAFDIETTRLDDEHSVMYIWQFQIGEDLTVIGRSWTEFKKFLRRLKDCRPEGERFVVWVHNLSFEFQFLRGIYPFKSDEVFLTDARKPLRVDMMDAFEFRCSYRHSNMSLEQYLKKMGVEHKKLELDYSVKRYPWTPLTDEEIAYCVNDVRGLVEALKKEMEMDGDNLYTVPLTSTGYVRRDAKKALRRTPPGYIREQLPTDEIFYMLRVAFRGGNTHASRFYSGRILRNVRSYDRSSSYPDVMINCRFPINEFYMLPYNPDPDYVFDLIKRRKKAVIMTVRLWGVRLSNPLWGFPYLSIDKCRCRVDRALEAAGLCYDNGRILCAEYVETTCTDVDLKIILSEYDFDDIEFSRVAFARYGELPPEFKRLIVSDYKYKTELKGVAGEEVFYEKRKNRLNSYYGMTAQSPVRKSWILSGGDYILDPEKTEAQQLEEYRKKGWLPYQWGCWVTAWARLRLEEGLRLAGDGAIYTDTDSVKYIGDVDWSAYNEERRQQSEKNGAWADDPKGRRHYMGVYEEDGVYSEFATLGAKKYAYRTPDGVLHATISGVNKKLGGEELEKAGGLTAFLAPGFIFREAGGRELKYLDREDSPVMIDGHRVRRRPSVTIDDSTYTLGITEDYDKLLTDSQIFHDFLREKFPENF